MSHAVWTLRRYIDVHAALQDDRLAPFGVRARADTTHRVVRESVSQELPPALMARWRVTIGARARDMLQALPVDHPVDLVRDFADPWALEVTAQLLGLSSAVVAACIPLARTVFEESATATSGVPSAALTHAATELAARLGGHGGVGTVQSFVAMSHTVPALVASSLHALLQHPGQLTWLSAHGNADTLAAATNELLRYAGPSRAVFRSALVPLEFGDATIGPGDSVVLLLSQANRDPAKFTDPDRLDVQRPLSGHLAFGAGVHGCVGAPIVRMMLLEAIAAFVASPHRFTLTDSDGTAVTWLDGFALRAPQRVPVIASTGTPRS